MSYIADRLKERISQAAIAAFLSSVAMVAGQPAAWDQGSLSMWLSLVQPAIICLIAVLIPEGVGATIASVAAEIKIPTPNTVVKPQAVPVPQPAPAPGGGVGGVAAALLMAFLTMAALSACSSAPPNSTAMQRDLLTAEDGYQVALLGASAYSSLPACSTGAKLCSDPDVVSDIVRAETAASIAFVQAETAILGCPVGQWRRAQASPPTATCGTPIADQDGQSQALTAAKAVVLTLVGVVPAVVYDPPSAPATAK